jgi:hypothetical protein
MKFYVTPVMEAVNSVSIRKYCMRDRMAVVDLALSHNPSTQFFLPKACEGFGMFILWRGRDQDAPVLEHHLYADEQTKTRKEHESDACARDRI